MTLESLTRRAGLLAAAAVLAVPTAAQNRVAVQAGSSEAVQAWSRAVEAGDLPALARMHGPHTVAYGADRAVVRGGETIVAGYAAMFDKFSARVQIRDAAWVREGALLHSWGEFTLTLTPRAGGQPVVLDGRFSDLAQRTDTGWQYLVDHASLAPR